MRAMFVNIAGFVLRFPPNGLDVNGAEPSETSTSIDIKVPKSVSVRVRTPRRRPRARRDKLETKVTSCVFSSRPICLSLLFLRLATHRLGTLTHKSIVESYRPAKDIIAYGDLVIGSKSHHASSWKLNGDPVVAF
jgi:hypothetical protein